MDDFANGQIALRTRQAALSSTIGLVLLAIGMLGCGSQGIHDETENESTALPPAVPTPTAKPIDPPVKLDRETEITAAEQLQQEERWTAAAAKLQSLLLMDPDDVEVVFRLANVIAASGDLPDAIELLRSIPTDHPEAGLPALGQTADWLLQLERYDEAEQSYRMVLEHSPQAAVAHRQLAYLLNRQGRRHEAADHIRLLCRQGNVRQDELHALIHLSDAMFDAPPGPGQPGPVDAADSHPYYPIGASALARKSFMDQNYQDAVDQLQESIAGGRQPPSIVALYGRAAAEAQDDRRFHWWLANTDDQVRQYAEYWAAIGAYLFMKRQPEQAIGALLQAVDRDPTDFRSIVRLRSALEGLGHTDQAERWSDRWQLLRDISNDNNQIAAANTPNVAAMTQMAERLESMERSLESLLWTMLVGFYQQTSSDQMRRWNGQLQQLAKQGAGFPDAATRLCEMNANDFPVANIESPPSDDFTGLAVKSSAVPRPVTPQFSNVANQIGLLHGYQVASEPLEFGFSVYQSVGGAVGVVDYDLDGHPDLYFAQGGADPPSFVGQQTNVLYRNVDDRLQDQSQASGSQEYRYSTGVTVGDWNQDGWADILVGNIGQNRLLLNAGDGTFRQVSIDDRDDKTVMTTSLAMGDLSGDSLPDIVELNYLDDRRIDVRPVKNEQGQVIRSLMPAEFNPGMDRLIINDGRGAARATNISPAAGAARAGLGVVMGDFDDQPGNELFVANDTYPNQFWIQSTVSGELVDAALLRGCAFAFDGVPTASMGVAAGDIDRNGTLDLHVTNFQHESANLYLNHKGYFEDRNVQFGLARPSAAVLGFGTQAIDYQNDGQLDLVVANGHVENALAFRASFEQPMQLFAHLGDRFAPLDVIDPSNYWSQKHLGRGLARLDFNRDGKMDFVVTHLGETSALLINQTQTANHWVQFQLVGAVSERDAIGAKVTVRSGGRELSEWVLAGDGFYAHNEAMVAFGLGESDVIDAITVRWPNGGTQTFSGVDTDRRWLINEGQSEPYRLW
ncbi:FG-GAP-like repeat-containing protein [Stieleria sp. TO1_6]|nr:FG-GAP-like repeat-containing protein [Stieleria tagensis]